MTDGPTRGARKSEPVSPGLSTWFVLHFFVDMLFALPLLFWPRGFLGLLGFTVVDPAATRLVGAALFAIGMRSLLGRNEDASALRAMLAFKILWASAATLALVLSLVDGAPVVVAGFIPAFVGFGVVWVVVLAAPWALISSGRRADYTGSAAARRTWTCASRFDPGTPAWIDRGRPREQDRPRMTERRDSARYATSWTGRIRDRRTALHVVDASEGGIFLAIQPPPAIGTNLIIEVVIDGRAVLLAGEVVRHERGGEHGKRQGVGLRLTRKPKDWDALVRRLGT